MKFVRIDDNNIQFVIENERYVDVYAYHNYNSDSDDVDYNKHFWMRKYNGWRLRNLFRYDKEKKISYRLEAEPQLIRNEGYYNYSVSFQIDDIEYHRIIEISYNHNNDSYYVTGDLCAKGKYYEDRLTLGSNMMNNKLESYLENEKLDYYGTNDVMKSFHEFNKKYWLKSENQTLILQEVDANSSCYEITDWLDREKGIVLANFQKTKSIVSGTKYPNARKN
nr:hypothetical protein [Bacilli bacterium]